MKHFIYVQARATVSGPVLSFEKRGDWLSFNHATVEAATEDDAYTAGQQHFDKLVEQERSEGPMPLGLMEYGEWLTGGMTDSGEPEYREWPMVNDYVIEI